MNITTLKLQRKIFELNPISLQYKDYAEFPCSHVLNAIFDKEAIAVGFDDSICRSFYIKNKSYVIAIRFNSRYFVQVFATPVLSTGEIDVMSWRKIKSENDWEHIMFHFSNIGQNLIAIMRNYLNEQT